MSEPENRPGTITWTDLTIDDVKNVCDFYQKVVGWSASPVPMGDYEDYCMVTPDGQTVAGICHARGENAGLPAQWLIYINVADLDRSIEVCQSNGGKLLHGPRQVGSGRYAVIEDPTGARAGLYQASS